MMRRYRQALNQEQCIEVLTRCSNGVLSLLAPDGYPYGVPLNYVLHEGNIYIHSSGEGRKIEAIKADGRASFTVIDLDQIDSARYTSLFRSVIVTGTIGFVDGDEWMCAFDALCDKYSPDRPLSERREKARSCSRAVGLKLSIVSMSGKEAKELIGISYT